MKNDIVSKEEWTKERIKLLTLEKEFTRKREEISKLRRDLPWTMVDKNYGFEGPDGQETFSDLFENRSQLIVYHFMFGSDWEEGCKACSFLAEHYGPSIIHLNQRDVSFVTISTAPQEKLNAYQKRMDWKFKWVTSCDDFNQDYNVTFTQEQIDSGSVTYNYNSVPFPMTEAPGISVFYKADSGEIYHTYSTYARGLDTYIGAYHYLDIVPKGRDEEEMQSTMQWLRHKDRYEN